MTKALEDTLTDMPFRGGYRPSCRSRHRPHSRRRGGNGLDSVVEAQRNLIPLSFEGKKKTTGLLKMKVASYLRRAPSSF